jgi:hypothetical protein
VIAIGRLLVASGLALAALGGLLWLGGRLGLTGLPGTITVRRGAVTVWLPLGLSVALSLALTLGLNLLARLLGR